MRQPFFEIGINANNAQEIVSLLTNYVNPETATQTGDDRCRCFP